MSKNIAVYIIGTAGSGKTTLTSAFKSWMSFAGYDAITINLDPGVEYIGYVPDIDIRDWLTLDQVMKEHNLGPNGAQIAAADMLALFAGEIATLIDKFETNYLLIDTPGQMELFTFRKSSLRIMDRFDVSRSVIVFLFDPFIGMTASGFLSQLMQSVTTALRFNLPLIRVLNKTDLVESAAVERMIGWSSDPECLYSSLCDEVTDPQGVFSLSLLRALEDVGMFSPIIPMSAQDYETVYPIYFNIQQLFAGGEDIDR